MKINHIEIDRHLNERYDGYPEVGVSHVVCYDDDDKVIKAFQTDLVTIQGNSLPCLSVDFAWRVYPNGKRHHVTRLFITWEYTDKYALVADCSGVVGLVSIRVIPIVKEGL